MGVAVQRDKRYMLVLKAECVCVARELIGDLLGNIFFISYINVAGMDIYSIEKKAFDACDCNRVI